MKKIYLVEEQRAFEDGSTEREVVSAFLKKSNATRDAKERESGRYNTARVFEIKIQDAK